MESAESQIVRFVIYSTVQDIKLINERWFVWLTGSRESIALSPATDPRPFAPGDEVKITFERMKPHDQGRDAGTNQEHT